MAAVGQNSNGPEPIGSKIRRLREAQGLSLERFAHLTVEHDPEGKGVSFGYIGRIERGLERPSVERMEMFAAMLGVSPNEFIEYRLARAREQLDERVVGLDQAAENLRLIRDALRETAHERPAKEAERQAQAAQRPQPAQRRKRNRRGDGRPRTS